MIIAIVLIIMIINNVSAVGSTWSSILMIFFPFKYTRLFNFMADKIKNVCHYWHTLPITPQSIKPLIPTYDESWN